MSVSPRSPRLHTTPFTQHVAQLTEVVYYHQQGQTEDEQTAGPLAQGCLGLHGADGERHTIAIRTGSMRVYFNRSYDKLLSLPCQMAHGGGVRGQPRRLLALESNTSSGPWVFDRWFRLARRQIKDLWTSWLLFCL